MNYLFQIYLYPRYAVTSLWLYFCSFSVLYCWGQTLLYQDENLNPDRTIQMLFTFHLKTSVCTHTFQTKQIKLFYIQENYILIMLECLNWTKCDSRIPLTNSTNRSLTYNFQYVFGQEMKSFINHKIQFKRVMNISFWFFLRCPNQYYRTTIKIIET